MNQQEFNERYGTEADCRTNWKEMRERNGVCCQRCGCTTLDWRTKRWEWRCKDCRTSLTLRSGTMLEHSNLPFLVWYRIMYLMTCTKKDLSALEMQRQVGWKRYEPIWYAMHKARIVMGNRDELYQLQGVVEVDEAFIKAIRRNPKRGRKKKSGPGKRGGGTESKSSVVVMATAEAVKNPRKGRPSAYPKYVKMYLAGDLKAKTIYEQVTLAITQESTIKTDAYRGYSKLRHIFRKHHAEVTPKKLAHISLPSVHTMIGNMKSFMNGVIHHVDQDYLQNYLDEFCCKANRRSIPYIFEKLVVAGVYNDWDENG